MLWCQAREMHHRQPSPWCNLQWWLEVFFLVPTCCCGVEWPRAVIKACSVTSPMASYHWECSAPSAWHVIQIYKYSHKSVVPWWTVVVARGPLHLLCKVVLRGALALVRHDRVRVHTKLLTLVITRNLECLQLSVAHLGEFPDPAVEPRHLLVCTHHP